MRSIREVGLLQPVGIAEDYTLVFGRRRLAALEQLGVVDIPVVVLSGATDVLTALRAERDENAERAAFTPIEANAMRLRIRGAVVSVRRASAAAAREERLAEADLSAEQVVPTVVPAAVPEDEPSEAPTSAAPPADVASPAAPPPTPVAATQRQVDVQVSEITGVSLSTMQRVDRIAALVSDPDEAVSQAASNALDRIEAGAAVKPQMDAVLAVKRWPVLATLEGEPAKQAAVAQFFAGLETAGEHEVLAREMETFAPTAAPNPVDAANREAAVAASELHAVLSKTLLQWESFDVEDIVFNAAPNMPDTTAESWRLLSKRIAKIAASIEAGMQTALG
jgi:hypothetical protein